MRTGSVDITITRSFTNPHDSDLEERDVTVTVLYEIDAYGTSVMLHRDDEVYGPLTDDEWERAEIAAREEALGDQ